MNLPKYLVAAAALAFGAGSAFGFTGGYSIGLKFGADEVSSGNDATLAPTDLAGITGFQQQNWNNYTLATSDSPQPVVADNSGASATTTTTVEWASNGTWANAAGASSDRGEHNNAFTGADFKLMLGYLDTGAPTTTTVTIHGIPSQLTTSGYNVIVYMLGGVSGRGGGYRITDLNDNEIKPWKNGDPPSNPSSYSEDPGVDHNDTGTYVLFTGLTATDIKVVASTDFGFGFGGTPRAPLNAVELVPFTGQKSPNFHTPVGNPIGFTMAIEDFAPIVVDTNTITVQLDNSAIPVSISKPGSVTTLTYDLFAAKQQFLVAGSQHSVAVSLKDTTGKAWASTNNFTVPNYPTLDPADKLATPATDPGMSATTFQLGQDANGNAILRTDSWGDDQGGNRIFKAEQELVGGFFDFATGKAYPNNVVTQGGTAKNNINLVNWEQGATDVAGEFFGSATTPADTAIPNDAIPGITPGNYDDYIAAEVVTYLRIPAAGLYRMGVASDDGFQVTGGQLGPFGTLLGIADVGRGVSESTFDFAVTQPGDYPFRLVWMEGTGGANCEWYMIDRTTGSRYLINGPQNNPLALKAFRTGQPRAYVQSISPANNYYFVDAKKPLTITLADGSTQVANGSVKLILNGNDVTSAATVQKSGTTTTVNYLPANGFEYAKDINGQLIWQESTTPATTWTNTFRFGVGGPFPYEFPAGSFWIEAEDFDNKGQELAVVDTMPYTGDGMNGMGAVPNVDYVNNDALTDTATIYRFANGDGSTPLNPYVDIATSTTAMLSMLRPQNTTMTANYKIGWSGDPDAYNYTRKVPAGVYTAYAGLSYDDGDTSPFDQPSRILAPLSILTAGAGTTNQTYQSIGSFQGPSTGGWSANNLAPLYGPDGTPAYMKISSPSTTFHVNVPSGDWDYFILMPATGVPAKFTGTTPDLRFPISRNAVVKWTFEDYSTTIDTTSAKLTVNGASVPAAQVTANKSGTTTTVTYTPAGLFDIGKTIPFALTVKDSGGATLTNSGAFMAHFMPASPTNMFLIEAEDFNLNGAVQPGVNTMPYLGNAYNGLSAKVGIDYFRNDTTPDGDIYRTNEVPNVPMSLQNDANGTVRAEDASGNPTWVLTNNFRLGWAGTGFWQDYTRQVPQGDYQVWASMSYGEAPSSTIRAIGNLSTVTSDATKTNQTTQVLGYFRGPATGAWGANQLVPLRLTTDATGDAAVVTLGGATTFQFEYASSDFDYFMLVPATGGGGGSNIKITSFGLAGGNLTIQWTGGGTLQSTTDLGKTFADIPGATTGSYSTAVTGAHQFFRVRQ